MSFIRTVVSYSKGVVSYLSNTPGESLFEVDGTISASNYLGIPTGSSTNIAAYNATATRFITAISPEKSISSPGQGPDIITNGPLITYAFTPDNDSDKVFRIFKIPTEFVSDPVFNIHWTKSGDVNEQNKNVRWKLEYSVFDGISEDALQTSGSLEFEDTYEDSGTTSRIVYVTSQSSILNFTAGHYISLNLLAISPVSASAMTSEPSLFALNISFIATLNKEV